MLTFAAARAAVLRHKLLVGAVVFGLLCAGAFLARKRAIDVRMGNRTVTLRLPALGYLMSRGCMLRESSGRHNREIASLLHAFWENPALILPGREPSSVLVLYQYDIQWLLIAFELTTPSRGGRFGFPLDQVVLQHQVEVRPGTTLEAEHVAAWLRHASDVELRQYSIPSADFGFVRFYGTRADLLRGLEQILHSNPT
jgi:hypothetical protein